MKKILHKHKKLLVRIGSILACLLLVGALALPCFADVTIDQVLEQENFLNSLYGGDVLNFSGLLTSAGLDYSSITSVVKLNSSETYYGSVGDVAISAEFPTDQLMVVYTSLCMLQLFVYNDGEVNPIQEYTYDSVLFAGIVNFNVADNGVVTYGVQFIFDGTDDILTLDFQGSVSDTTLAFSYQLMGVRLHNPTDSVDIYYDILPYEFDFYLAQIGNGVSPIPGVTAYQNLFGEVYYPARDLLLNVPEGGASEEELQAEYQRGYEQGERVGTQIGYDIGYNEGEEAGYNEGYQLGLTNGANIGYDEGYLVGVNKGQTDSIGENFFGNTFSAIIDGLRSFTIIEFPNGYSYSLLDIVTAIVAISVFVLFLKMFAGG